MRLRRLFASLFLCLVLPPALAGAGDRALFTRYEVHIAGFTMMQAEMLLDLGGPQYRIRTWLHTTGLVGLLSSGEQTTLAEGTWHGADPVPMLYRLKGNWRGSRRQVAIDYTPPGQPQLREIEPPNEADREAVPETLQYGTMDSLSAMAKLSRTVAQTGRCDVDAAVFDGRRRMDYSVRTGGFERLPTEGAFGGNALRCDFEGRIIAGIRGGQEPEDAHRPQFATIWIAQVLTGRPPVPVRIELPSRWFGTVRLVLVSFQPG